MWHAKKQEFLYRNLLYIFYHNISLKQGKAEKEPLCECEQQSLRKYDRLTERVLFD